MQHEKPHVVIILLNWNHWEDTVQCLASLRSLSYPSYTVVVCDNDSQDQSLEHIQAWCRKEDQLVAPVISRDEVLSTDAFRCLPGEVVLIQNGSNLGYAGGNNVGIQYARKVDPQAYVWLLNNDTTIHPEALSRLVQRVEEDSSIGLCGSTVCFADKPGRIHLRAGSSYKLVTGRVSRIGAGDLVETEVDRGYVEGSLDYVAGASMLVTPAFLDGVGLLAEDYFLYHEEIDWAFRGKASFKLGYAPESIVYHKIGGSLGTLGKGGHRSAAADFFIMRSRLRFIEKFFPELRLVARLGLLWSMVLRIGRGQWSRVGFIARLVMGSNTDAIAENFIADLSQGGSHAGPA